MRQSFHLHTCVGSDFSVKTLFRVQFSVSILVDFWGSTLPKSPDFPISVNSGRHGFCRAVSNFFINLNSVLGAHTKLLRQINLEYCISWGQGTTCIIYWPGSRDCTLAGTTGWIRSVMRSDNRNLAVLLFVWANEWNQRLLSSPEGPGNQKLTFLKFVIPS